MDLISWYAIVIGAADLLIVVGLGYRIVMRRRPTGVTLAWLIVLTLAPFLGAFFYLLLGESRLGERNARRFERIQPAYRAWLAALPRDAGVDWPRVAPECRQIHQLATSTIGIPTLAGNRMRLLDDAEEILRALVADIDRAERHVDLEFYIWNVGGIADDAAAALLRAAKRGVACRVLLDAYGSRPFFKHEWAHRLRDGGVHLAEALPRSIFVRADHRLHRKVAIVDGRVAYVGSLNLVDPRFFKQGAGVGEWVDAMTRIEGPAVEALGVVFVSDWELATGEGLDELADTLPVPDRAGDANVQVVPSGPGTQPEAIHKLLLATMYAARRELVVTTPYFVPTDSVLIALVSAAERGVETTVVLPARTDSVLVHYAARSTFDDLLRAGVRIARFGDGLLHTKSITVDGRMSLFGSVNLDMRSFYLNFEISVLVYDPGFTGTLRALQERYLRRSEILGAADWARRTRRHRLAENVCHLASPLL